MPKNVTTAQLRLCHYLKCIHYLCRQVTVLNGTSPDRLPKTSAITNEQKNEKKTERNRKHPHLKKIERRYTAKQQAQCNWCPQRCHIIACPARLYPTRVISEAPQGYSLPPILSVIYELSSHIQP